MCFAADTRVSHSIENWGCGTACQRCVSQHTEDSASTQEIVLTAPYQAHSFILCCLYS